MRITPLLVTISLCCGLNTAVLAHKNKIPVDYPSHEMTGGCIEPIGLADMQQKLQEYNDTRVHLDGVLYAMADSYKLDEDVREGVLGFAETFKRLGMDMPPPDPDSDEFRNFDFKLGLSLTALTVFLNSRDETLTRQFQADRDNPESAMGLYLAELDRSRAAYMDGLEDINNPEKSGTCS